MHSWILDEAKRRKKKARYGIYKGRRVRLDHPSYGDVKRFKVYVVNPKTGLVKKINFGDRDMDLRKLDDTARASFLKKFHCNTAKNKATAEYWLCRLFKSKSVESLLRGESMLKKGGVLKEAVGSDVAKKIAEVWLFGGVADRIDDSDDDANVLSGKLRGYGRDVMDAVPSFMEDYDVSVEKYLGKLLPVAQEMVDRLNKQWAGKLTLEELEEEMGERVVTQFALGLLGHGVGMYDDMDVEKFMKERGVSKPDFHAYEAEMTVSMDAADELLQAVKEKDGDEMGESRKVVGFRKSMMEAGADGYSFSNKEEQIAALIEFYNDNGKWQEEYFKNPDYAEAFDHMLKEGGPDESDMGDDFKAIWKKIPKDKQKDAWDWIVQNVQAEFNYWGSPGHRQDNSAYSMPHGGEEEVQLIGMSGRVNGKETNDVLAELTKGLSDEEIKKAENSNEYYVDGDYLYVNASYSIIDFPVDLEEFETFLDEEGILKKDVEESRRVVESDEDKKVQEFEIEDIGFDHSQYFRGRGTSHSDWEEVAVGVSSSAHEALEDALEQLASNGWDVSGDLEKEVESLKKNNDMIAGYALHVQGDIEGEEENAEFVVSSGKFEFAEIEAKDGGYPAAEVTSDGGDTFVVKSVNSEDAVEEFKNTIEDKGMKLAQKSLDKLEREAQRANDDNEMYYHVAIYVK